jgi:hypothetical protein
MPQNINPVQKPKPQQPPPPKFIRTWVKYVVAFSVSVVVGLAPYLGRVHVPLFTPLLSLIPQSLQDLAIPLASAMMGIIAVCVQWLAETANIGSYKALLFGLTLAAAVLSLLVFTGIQFLAVVRVEVPAANSTISYAIGLANPQRPPCENLSRAACIAKLSLNEAVVDSYFGETSTNVTKFLLVVTYIAFMCAFAFLVGVLMLPPVGPNAPT